MNLQFLLTSWQPSTNRHYSPPFWDPRTSAQKLYGPQDPLKASTAVGNFIHSWCCQGEEFLFFTEACNTLSKILPRGPRKDRNFSYKPQALGYSLLLIDVLGPCWGLGPRNAFDHDAKTSYSERTQHRVICQRVGRAREGPCQPLVGLSSTSLAGLSSSSSPLSERITLPCQVRKSIPSPAGQTASQTCVYFLGWHM